MTSQRAKESVWDYPRPPRVEPLDRHVRVVLGGETISSVSGVGRNIALAAELMEPARMYAWIVVVIATALVLNTLISMIENRMREH